ncbi:CDP-diacylglycerol--glycerol-3-phosphate 3-phosphatidyltransferase [Haploplasma axanthum]|uniref:CDP-diacylglycerol--glycerol-3-phosphate 3-phosphatidyltransferase n=1 Tax=Haploplasma axanthum TaxID=29552 RepID=A0A449BE05_HAPAX|nr:CDP-diacylglycerol--glycerol-3-phosphate 3-phosphatidyltransferase [Haploplasma axanthum]VEU80679.1 CDP-diacylglycerol--glycerol-3-phosphate 3-phosphatidyltransferase [Haploplasma axanthum]
MTLPNKITLLRLILIPVMVVFMMIPSWNDLQIFNTTIGINELIVATIFTIAAFTDFLDGYLARKNNQITTFGKFLDPIADKVLVITAMIYLVSTTRIAVWPVVIVIFREFVVTGVRLLAVEKGTVIAASPYGKIKTAATMVALLIMLFSDFGLPLLVGDIVWYIAIFFTLLSGLDYVLKNKAVIFESM